MSYTFNPFTGNFDIVGTGGTTQFPTDLVSVTPSAGKIPVAGANGKIDSGWVDASSSAGSTLSAVSATLHRSPNAITALFVYDTSKDSDGGAWTEKCQHTSWYRESLNGKWLGTQTSESTARAVSGATTGDYYQLTTDGKFYALSAGSGVTEVFRGNKRSFPKLAAVVAEATSVTIYDLTESGNPMWMRFIATATATVANKYLLSGANALAATQGRVFVGGAGTDATGLTTIDFAKDMARLRLTSGYTWNGNLSMRNTVGGYTTIDAAVGGIVNATANAVATTVLLDAPVDLVTGLKIPTIAVATGGGASVIKHNGTVVNSSSTVALSGIRLNQRVLTFGRHSVTTFSWALNPGALGSSFVLDNANTVGNFTTSFAQSVRGGQGVLLRRQLGGRTISLLKHNEATIARSLTASLNEVFNTGWLMGDIRRCYLANSKTADRSYRAATATEAGTVTATAANTGADLIAYSGFSAANYIQEAYSAQLDFGTGEWTCSAWVSIPANNAAARTLVCREHSSGAYIRLGIDATSRLTATAHDGTTTRTVTTSASYNTATWLKARVNYTTDGKLAILVNGVEVASATGTALLTLNNSNAVLTIGNSYALDAPFPGSIALLKFSATVPTAEQSQWMYEQEKHLFSAGAKCLLPNTSDVRELAYDDATDTWSVAQETMESTWSGLVRASTQAPSAGLFSRNAEASGVQLLGRISTNPGVDVRMPAKNLRPKDMPGDTNQDITVFDFDAVTSQTDFVLPAGYTARVVYSAGAQKRLGSTKDYTVLFDGFRETTRFAVAPGNGVWVQIHAVKEITP